jgi:hypothetical protein
MLRMLKVLCATLLFVVLHPSLSQGKSSSSDIDAWELRGTLGNAAIGLQLNVQRQTTLVSAHYFYARYLKDIPLSCTHRDITYTCEEPGGGQFTLHLVTSDPHAERPVTFYNSTGLIGTWSNAARPLPVKLSLEHSLPLDRLYAGVTEATDASFESMVQAYLHSVLAGDRVETAKHIDFPLVVNRANHHPLRIRTPAELTVRWNDVFTPAYLAELRKDIPHEMFVHEGEAMLGDGDTWIDERGIAAINLP